MKFNFNNQQPKITSNKNSLNTEKKETTISLKFNFNDKKQENNQNIQETPDEKQDAKAKNHEDK